MKRLSILVLVLILMASAAMAESPAAQTARFEGDGYDTPEEAVLAYIDALNRADVHGMLATFAHESYIAHFDPELYIRRANSLFPSGMINETPVTDAFSADLVLHARYGNIITLILSQYTEYTDSLNGETRAPMDQERIDTHFARYGQSFFHDPAGHVESAECLDTALLTRYLSLSPLSRRNFALQYAYAGADDLADVAVYFRINGSDLIQCMTCARYDGRWYNLSLQGYTASILGVPASLAGLIRVDDRTKDAYFSFTESPDSDELLAEREQYTSSPLGGTRWQMVSLDPPDIELKDSAEEALLSDRGLWCEVRFYSFGGAVITLAAGPRLRQTLGMHYRREVLSAAWSEADGLLRVEELRVSSLRNIPVGVATAVSASFDGETITFCFDDGTVAVFRQAD